MLAHCIRCSAIITGVPIHDGFGTCSVCRQRARRAEFAFEPCPFGPKTKTAIRHRADHIDWLRTSARVKMVEHRSSLPYSIAVREWTSYVFTQADLNVA